VICAAKEGRAVSEIQPTLISALPPSREQWRLTAGVMLLLVVLFLLALWFARVPLAKIDPFIPIVATLMFVNDSITSALLFAQFAILRSRAILVLANGYLFTALTIIPYALTFPGAFAPTGLLGAGRQAPPWLNTIWHVALPAAVIAYAVLANFAAKAPPVGATARRVIAASVAGMTILVCAMTWFITQHDELLPVFLVNDVEASIRNARLAGVAFTLLSGAAALLLCLRPRSILDLALMLVCVAWLLGSLLFTYVQTRFTVAWYAIRVFEMAAASFVLLLLLGESTVLYARLALSVIAHRREREGRMMSMDAVSAAIAHEIRQPLAAIAANASAGKRWLARIPPDINEARQNFDAIAADNHRSNEVIASVRALFAQTEPPRTVLDANELVRGTIALVRHELQERGIAVELDLATPSPRVSAHHGQLQEVLLNLVRNAADAMRDIADRTPVLRISSRPLAPNSIELSVADCGTGIDPKISERIFDPFFTTKTNGMGMGLALCRSIAEAHGGALSVSPRKPNGSIFRIVLPRADWT
jgi:signal transduction histidine kinase